MILKHSIFGIAFVLLLLKRSERFLSFPETMKEKLMFRGKGPCEISSSYNRLVSMVGVHSGQNKSNLTDINPSYVLFHVLRSYSMLYEK